ncbi:MAG: hypothetical protein V4675_01210 [Verrucomicrobiota bacterium]
MDKPPLKFVPLVPPVGDSPAYGRSGFEPHPGTAAFILSIAVVLIGMNVFPLFPMGGDPVPLELSNWLKIGVGLILWFAGMALMAQARYMPWVRGIWYGLLFLPGLILLLWRARHHTRRSAWESEEELRRRFRPMRRFYHEGLRGCAKPDHPEPMVAKQSE